MAAKVNQEVNKQAIDRVSSVRCNYRLRIEVDTEADRQVETTLGKHNRRRMTTAME